MKLKEFLFQKVNKDTLKNESVQRAIKLTICGAFIFALLFQLVGCLFAPLTAYASVPGDTVVINDIPSLPAVTLSDLDAVLDSNGVQESTMILKAGTYRFNDCISAYNSITAEQFRTSDYYNIYIDGLTDVNGNFIGNLCCVLVNGSYSSDGYTRSYNNYTELAESDYEAFIYYNGYYNRVKDSDGSIIVDTNYLCEWETDKIVNLTKDVYVIDSIAIWFISNTNYYEVNPPPHRCPTLPELLADYTGSFDSIVDMLNSTNYQEYEDFVSQLEQDAFDRGVSTGFGENVLGSAFNAPLTALNQWVLFETTSGFEVTMGGLFTAIIAIAVLVIFLKMFAGG